MINTQEKVNLLVKLTNLTKEGKIKSFLKNNLIVDITNINKIKYKEDDIIKISNKYIHLFKDYSFEELKPFLNHSNNFNLITHKEKYITFNLSNHACEQLLKRMIYIYVKGNKFEWSVRMQNIYNTYLDIIVNILKNKEIEFDLINNRYVIEIIESLLNGSEVFTLDKSGRHRDKKSFIRRDNLNGKAVRYFNHPFMFIVQDDYLKTVELYSSSEDCRHLNKETTGKEFYSWFNKKFN